MPPAVSSSARVGYLDTAAPWAGEVGASGAARAARLSAGLALRVRLLFDEDRADLRHEEEWEAVLFPLRPGARAADAASVDFDDRDFRPVAPEDAVYVLPEAPIQSADFFRDLAKELEEHLYRSHTLGLWRNTALKLYSRPGETREAFERRCVEAAEKSADDDAAKLRDRFERKIEMAKDRRDQAARRLRELEVDVGARKQQEIVAGAGELLSMFLGGRARTRSLSGLASRRSQTRRTQERLESATERVEDVEEAIEDLEAELAEELEKLWAAWKEKAEDVQPFEVALEKSDIRVEQPTLFWGVAG